MATEEKVPTYLELISKDEKTVQKENLKITAQEAALNVSREILALSSEETAQAMGEITRFQLEINQ